MSLDPAVRRRRIIMAAAIILMLSGFGAFSAAVPIHTPPRAVDIVRLSGLMALALVVAIRSTTSFSFARRNPELDDELSRANRASAAAAGFWTLLLAVCAAEIASLVTDLTLLQATPVILALGAVVAGVRFASLEAKGEKNG